MAAHGDLVFVIRDMLKPIDLGTTSPVEVMILGIHVGLDERRHVGLRRARRMGLDDADGGARRVERPEEQNRATERREINRETRGSEEGAEDGEIEPGLRAAGESAVGRRMKDRAGNDRKNRPHDFHGGMPPLPTKRDRDQEQK